MALPTVRAAHRVDAPAVITPLAHRGQWDDDEVSARGYRQADLIVATTDADADIYLGLGVDPERVRVCPLPTPAPTGAEARSVRDRARIEGPLVLFVGVRRGYKGIPELLAAAEILARRTPEARVAIAGPGPRLTDPPANVIDVGEVSDPDRDAWLRAADLVCLPSSQESFGLAVSEAWSVGAPAVTSDIPVLRERISRSGGGIATSTAPAPLADALGTLLNDEPLRRRMGAAGHDYWRRHESPESVADWHRTAYAGLLR
jgi:glycosyltransferase involved in cell wall biosynthesis